MVWNWQQADWPKFRYDGAALASLEERFLLRAGELFGAFHHVSPNDRDTLRIELISDEALKTSEIEGEILNRNSVQSSLRQQMGLDAETRRILPEERGIAEMMVALYRYYDDKLTHKTLFSWHQMVMAGHRDVQVIGGYREHNDPMHVVSGPIGRERVHFEAPPSSQIRAEMDAFIKWFNGSAPNGKGPLPALIRSGIAHLYFESIHPFEDGNGRIGRALSEKALAQNLGQPTLIALAFTIERNKMAYYDMLARSNKSNEITNWLVYFAETILEAQANTLKRIDFYIAKARLYERLRGTLNPRQEKALARMFREGVEGFKGGLSAENYIRITGASRATATRDLQDLVDKGALTRTGERRHTRYWLANTQTDQSPIEQSGGDGVQA